MPEHIAIVDLFSGPGGLGEGFASVKRKDGSRAFRIAVSIEKEASAHRTLRLRAFLRQFDRYPQEYLNFLHGADQPDWARLYPAEWQAAEHEAQCLELGKPETWDLIEARIAALEASGVTKTLLIGGPPCQAYSLVGRARNAGTKGYVAEEDHRHFLYKEYCKVLNRLKPTMFVMENVKGILSSAVGGGPVFGAVMEDLEQAGYRLCALTSGGDLLGRPAAKDFILRAEEHGVPQARHRVIVVGLRDDLGLSAGPFLPKVNARVTVEDTIGAMPELRSGLSKADKAEAWIDAVALAVETVSSAARAECLSNPSAFRSALNRTSARLYEIAAKGRSKHASKDTTSNLPTKLAEWLGGMAKGALPGHDTRGHMVEDLARYLFAAAFAKAEGYSPKAADFPQALAPNHKSWTTGKFADRFRVQLADQPSTTVTSHIAKDGHYFIHPDPAQCRSLTVREAARLQTFPDDYMFLGNRTQQYVQVGNAVPPWLARQIAEALLPLYDKI
ncbi:DNA cytosine methyltransferase [Rhodobacter sp. KR11]|uniref:DNA cytosine methyltransferase n=1 Tax=Rhodobacter sp. KR11 TaxID=2974588 RepID=UPI0022213835|nr:DNA cytosine methyltransferase [Rhodobacter sp. KR11]MCW1918034.1 DNA cytosine methyltransferase [Rhodobacter sp. KR11]